jgi:hypothetical protein
MASPRRRPAALVAQRLHDAADNPLWATRALALDWAMLSDLVEDPAWMPALTKAHASRKGELVAQMETLGCGVYGCVLETGDPQVVLKLTTDDSEVAFATEVLPGAPAEAQAGVVRYLESAPLHAQHKGHEVVALWRQSAEHVGKLLDPKVTPSKGDRKALEALIHRQWSIAQVGLRTIIEADDAGELYEEAMDSRGAWTPPSDSGLDDVLGDLDDMDDDADRLASALMYFREACEMMARSGTVLEGVGRALLAFLDRGVFVADVHDGNLGQVTDEHGEQVWVITDPGNTVVLPGPWP